jgi:hypothetical protein
VGLPSVNRDRQFTKGKLLWGSVERFGAHFVVL